MGTLLSGKNILIMGVRNRWSIAWGIAKAAHNEGANLIFTYQGDREKEGVVALAENLGNVICYSCNVSDDQEISDLFGKIGNKYKVLHGLVHAIAHAKSEDLKNGFINTSRDGFLHAMNVSAFSFVIAARHAKDLMTEGGSMVTLTYMGSERVFKGYNVMGVAKAALESSVRYLAADLGPSNIRVNSISAGPINTVSAKGVSDFKDLLSITAERSPLARNITQEEIGGCALYLLSYLSGGMTGEILYVDNGYNIMGV